MEKTKRLIWADALKGYLILTVILGHAIQYCLPDGLCEVNYWWKLIYSFHMAAFIAISGFVNYKSKTGCCKRRYYQLFIPFVLWLLIYWRTKGGDFATLANIFFRPDGYLWFLWVLFVISLLFVNAIWISKKLRVKLEYVVFFLCLLLIGIMIVTDFRLFGYQFIAYYFLFYAIGYFANRYKEYLVSNNWYLISLFCIWMILASFWSMHDLPFFLSNIPFIPASLLQYGYRFITAFVAIIFLLSFGTKYLNSDKNQRMIVCCGNMSLGFTFMSIYHVSYQILA
ncbi:MAG: acyltransferase family protein [Bacteroides thetaiotaomicron]